MPIIAKRQPLYRPSIQSPPTITAIFIFDVIADKVHYKPWNILEAITSAIRNYCIHNYSPAISLVAYYRYQVELHSFMLESHQTIFP